MGLYERAHIIRYFPPGLAGLGARAAGRELLRLRGALRGGPVPAAAGGGNTTPRDL
jgi:hypothetical protein